MDLIGESLGDDCGFLQEFWNWRIVISIGSDIGSQLSKVLTMVRPQRMIFILFKKKKNSVKIVSFLR